MSTTTHKMLGSPTGNPEAANILMGEGYGTPGRIFFNVIKQ
ncbi:MAG: hypothetical protein V3S85_03840 [Nitrospirales bacterium]